MSSCFDHSSEFHVVSARVVRPDHHVIDDPTRFDTLFRFSRWITYTSLISLRFVSKTAQVEVHQHGPHLFSQILIRWIHQSLESHGPFSVVTAWQTLISDTSRQFMWNMLPYDAVPILRIPTSICQVSCRAITLVFLL